MSATYDFKFRHYGRHFRQPLRTSHGIWQVREGIIFRLSDRTGRIGWGEIAPLPWFGSETIKAALAFCQQLGKEVSSDRIKTIPASLPACQFGFEAALEELMNPHANSHPAAYSWLLPAGEAALDQWQGAWHNGGSTFKWKIGAGSFEEEIKIFKQLVAALPKTAQLRLDANGGLDLEEAKKWLQAADSSGIVEFIEQPLPPQQFDEILALSDQYSTPLALDESVATINQLESCYQRGWQGIYVIKAAIAGSPKRLQQFCQEHPIDAVFSSVFETAIAQKSAFRLAASLANPQRAIGYGVKQWFKEEDTWLQSLKDSF